MVYSMTGFGRGESADEAQKITVEIKSVNHRYLDLNIKLPRKLNAFEASVRNTLKDKLLRGKVDVYITLDTSADAAYGLRFNQALAAQYFQHINTIAEEFNITNDITATKLSRYQDVFEMEEAPADEDALGTLLAQALGIALDQFIESRKAEGARLAEDLLQKMDELVEHVSFLEKKSPEIVEEYSNKLKAKVADLLADGHIDEGRIAAEVVLYADKVCIDEEMVRLRSHVDETRSLLAKGGEVGRRLDFIAQELNRESNTILSKSTDAEIAGVGISLKTLIEKVREQIQNLE